MCLDDPWLIGSCALHTGVAQTLHFQRLRGEQLRAKLDSSRLLPNRGSWALPQAELDAANATWSFTEYSHTTHAFTLPSNPLWTSGPACALFLSRNLTTFSNDLPCFSIPGRRSREPASHTLL